jgi:hypothetical protein
MLVDQVKRSTPFALHLFGLLEDRPGELVARSALSEFYKFRGFIESDERNKIGLYREALRLNPSNGNVHELLAALGETAPENSSPSREEDDRESL